MKKKYNFPLKFKAVIIIIALSIILCAVSIAMSSIRFSKTNEENFKNQCRDLAYTVALTINSDDLHKVKATPHKDRLEAFARHLLADFPLSCTKSL